MLICLCRAVSPHHWLAIHLTIDHEYTLEAVAILLFFLPRVECTVGIVKRFCNQIWESIRP